MFDLDGTMWDSAVGVAASWNEVFREADASLPALTAGVRSFDCGFAFAQDDNVR